MSDAWRADGGGAFGEKYALFSRMFERFAIDVLQECSISGACGLLRISWDEADRIKQRAVKRGWNGRRQW